MCPERAALNSVTLMKVVGHGADAPLLPSWMTMRRGMLRVVHAAAELGRLMVSVPPNVRRVALKTASERLLAAALSSIACTLSMVPPEGRLSSMLVVVWDVMVPGRAALLP